LLSIVFFLESGAFGGHLIYVRLEAVKVKIDVIVGLIVSLVNQVGSRGMVGSHGKLEPMGQRSAILK
jgi:hypothetical protein